MFTTENMKEESFLGDNTKPLGIRQNNPFNLRATTIGWLGKITPANGFERFKSLYYGLRAGMLDHFGDFYGGKNLREVINENSPASENNTAAYIALVCARTGLSPSSTFASFTPDIMTRYAKAIIEVENDAASVHLFSDEMFSNIIDNLPFHKS